LSARYKSHCGAIATPPSLPLTSSPYDFQSHCGAIATSVREIPDTPPKKPLSIPLWCDCDQRLLAKSNPDSDTFNPTVVRLRPLEVPISRGLELHFQSHCGAIATFVFIRYFTPLFPFNPTVVRLRRR